MKKLFLLDAYALIFRAHYAFIKRPLINSKGMNTSAIAGFTRTLWDLLQHQKPSHLGVVFDPPRTFRNDIYPEYKSNREETPNDIRIAAPIIKDQLLPAFNIPAILVPNYEADDVIGTLAVKAAKQGYEVYMVTPDKDFGQLVTQQIKIYKPGRRGEEHEIIGPDEVDQRWNIDDPLKVIDILALQGDSVDNIPGVPGIGPKTAAKLINQFGDLEAILSSTDQLKGKQKENLETYAEQARLSYVLATIALDAPIEFEPDQLIIDPPNTEQLGELFKELEFRTLANDIIGASKPSRAKSTTVSNQGSLFASLEPAAHEVAESSAESVKHTYHLVQDKKEMERLAANLKQHNTICLDTETTNIDANLAELVGLSLSTTPHEAYYIPIPEDRDEALQILKIFQPIFNSKTIQKIGQNIKYDALVLKWYDTPLEGDYLDTMIAHYLLEPDLRHNMDYLSETYLKYKPISIEKLIGPKGKNQRSMRQVPIEIITEYAAEDADITLQLANYLQPELERNDLVDIYRKVEEPLIKVLRDMEFEGVKIDDQYLHKYSEELSKQIIALQTTIYEEAGTPFNLNSPKQIGEILFEKLKIPYRWSKTKTGQYRTNEEKLTELSVEHPFVAKILEYRSLAKLKSTYVDSLPKLINPRSGRIHSSFNQALAATGRLSSNNPNLQNIPIKTAAGRKVREAFIPRNEDYVIISADYSQVELRLIAEISQDQALLEAFQKGQDVHRATAARVYKVPYEAVTDTQRRNAKTVNFSITYGAGATNLSNQLNIPRKEASELIESYFAEYKGLKQYMDDTITFAQENGYVTTLLGRRRFIRDINSNSSLARSNAERMAINTPIQGTAADMIKIAMINIHQRIREENMKSRMIIQVHDELVFDTYQPEQEKMLSIILELMPTAIPTLSVPITVEAGVGKNWLEAH